MANVSQLPHAAAGYIMALLGALLGLLTLVPAVHAQVMDCRTVDCSRRDVCNLNVLSALGRSDRLSEDDVRHTAIEILMHREERLRSYLYYEGCVTPPRTQQPACVTAPPKKLGFWGQFMANAKARALFRGSPPFSSRLAARTGAMCTANQREDETCEEQKCVEKEAEETKNLLVGRWSGWQGFSNNSASPIAFNIIRVTGSHVKACSDHGMVNGSIESDGSLVFARLRALEVDYRFKLWRVAEAETLRGSALVAIDRSREVVAGPVWLSKRLEPAAAELVPDACE